MLGHRLPAMITIDTSYSFPITELCNFTWVLGTIIPYHTPVTNLDCVWQYTCYRGRGNAWDPESVIFQGVTLVLCWHHSVQIHAIFSACFLTTYTLQHKSALPTNLAICLHVIPRFHTPCSIVDVSLRRMQHCCGWHQLCDKGGKIMWTLHNHIIVFAHKLPPDNLLCTSTNTVDDTFFMGWGKVFPQNSAIEPLDHIVPLVHELWLYDGALLWNISNWVTFCNDIGCVAHITKHVTHVTQNSVTCVTVFYFMFYAFIYVCWSFIC